MRGRVAQGRAGGAIAYLFAVGTSAVAIYLSFLLDGPLQGHPFPILLSAVMLSAWFGGLGPGLLATAIGGLVIDYYFEEPRHSLMISSWGTMIRLVVFLVAATLISSLSAQLRLAERAAAAGRVAAEQLAGLITASEDAVVSATLEGLVVSWNPGAERLLGRAASDAVGRPVAQLVAASGEAELPRVLERLRHGERFGHYETTWTTLGGRQVDVSVRVSPVTDGTGRVTGGVIVARDLGDRRERAETAGRLAAIVESSDEAIVGKSLDGTVISWNPAAERLYAYSSAEMIGRSIATIVPEDRRSELASILERLRRGEQISRLRTVRVRKDGRRVGVVLTATPVRSALGDIVGAAAVAHPVAEIDELAGAAAAARSLAGRLAGLGQGPAALTSVLETARDLLRGDTASVLGWRESEAVLVAIASSPPAPDQASSPRRDSIR